MDANSKTASSSTGCGVLVVGPTASGKSQWALDICSPNQWPIVNVDSIQMYSGLQIGSAMPTLEDQKKTPHFLYGFVPPVKTITVADYLNEVHRLKQQLSIDLPWFFCGGSGFYLQALEKGMVPLSQVTEEIRARVQERISTQSWSEIHQYLRTQGNDKIHVNDHYRLRRALEVEEIKKCQTGSSEQLQSPLRGCRLLKMGWRAEKEILRQRIMERTDKMLKLGWVEEVRALMDLSAEPWAPLMSVGYMQIVQYLNGEIAKVDLKERINTATMQLTKKQMTWFKRDHQIHWWTVGDSQKANDFVLKWLESDSMSK